MNKLACALAATCAFSLAAAAPAFASDKPAAGTVQTAAKSEFVRGEIKEIHAADKSITVKETTFKYDEKTQIVKNAGAHATAADLVKGANITARVKDGVAARIEIHTGKK